ncbi:MAG: dihydrodipicolinate synthase family protein [Bacillota bacterium]|nr:dihydrodipicolinate synthase family protein [Bacillota bacterium]
MNTKDGFFRPAGVYPAMVTPFDDKGEVNEEELRKYVSWMIEKGVSGLFPLGSVGEFIHLSFEEKVKVMGIVVDEARGEVPVVPGTAESCADKCIKLTKAAKEVGCQSVVIAPPYYFPATQEIIEEHYTQVAKAVPDFPIILYNIPLFAQPISYDVIKRLSRMDNVVGMKDSSGSMVDLLHFMDKIKIAGEELNIMIGREEMFLASLMAGAKGTMSATVGVVPEIMVAIYDAWQRKEYDKAQELQFSVLNLIRAMFALPFPQGFKAALEVRGFKMGPNKQPLSSADQYNYSMIKSRLERILVQRLGDKVKVDV